MAGEQGRDIRRGGADSDRGQDAGGVTSMSETAPEEVIGLTGTYVYFSVIAEVLSLIASVHYTMDCRRSCLANRGQSTVLFLPNK